MITPFEYMKKNKWMNHNFKRFVVAGLDDINTAWHFSHMCIRLCGWCAAPVTEQTDPDNIVLLRK